MPPFAVNPVFDVTGASLTILSNVRDVLLHLPTMIDLHIILNTACYGTMTRLKKEGVWITT